MANNTQRSDQSDEDIVDIHVKVYHVKCEDREPDSFLVGDHGLKYPKHEEHMHWIPKGLVYKISEPDPTTGMQTISIPRWLAAKKGFKYRD